MKIQVVFEQKIIAAVNMNFEKNAGAFRVYIPKKKYVISYLSYSGQVALSVIGAPFQMGFQQWPNNGLEAKTPL